MNINLTLIASSIVFLILLFVVMRFIWPPLIAAIEARQQKIAEGLAAAERGKNRLHHAEQEAHEILRKARIEATEIINQGEHQAHSMIHEAKSQAKIEGERILEKNRETMQVEVQKARATLQENVASLALATATQILGREVTTGNHDQLLQEMKSKL